MNEKASRNEGAEGTDSRAENSLGIPGIPVGEEIALGPVEGDGIDPLPKWWDEPIETDRGKVGNRRLEDGVEPEAPRRKKLRSLDEAIEVPADGSAVALPTPMVPEPDTAAPEAASMIPETAPVVIDPVEAIARAEASESQEALEPKEEESSADRTFFNMPEIDAGTIKVKRARKGEGTADDGDLSVFFGDASAGAPAAEPEPDEPALAEDRDLETEKSIKSDESVPQVPPADAAPSPKGPPPIPVKFDGAFEEKKPLIASVVPPVKMRPPGSADPAPKAAPPELPASPAKEPATVVAAATPAAEDPMVESPVTSTPIPPLPDPVATSAPSEASIESPAATTESPAQEPSDVTAVTTGRPEETIAATDAETTEAPPVVERPEPKETETGEEVPEKAAPSDPAESGSIVEEVTSDAIRLPESEESFAVIGDPLPLEEPKDASGGRPESVPVKKKAGCWTVFATLFFFATMLVLVLLGAGVFYAWSKAGRFTGEFAEMTRGKLEEKGIHLDYGTWSYQFPRGFVFDEVTIFDDASKARPVVKATGLGVNVDLLGLAKDPGSLGAAEFSLRDSKVTLYQKGELFSEISGVEGEILADASAVSIERLSAILGGLRVRLDGVVKLPDKDAVTSAAPGVAVAGEAAPSPLAAIDFSAFRAFAPWFAFDSTGGELPLLSLSFAMDAREPDLATIEGTLGGTAVKWRGIEFASLSAGFRIDPKSGELRFPNVQAGFGDGLIGAVLAVDMASQTLKIERLQSTANLAALLTAYDVSWGETFKNVKFVDAPTIQVTGEVPLADPVNAKLEIRYEHLQGIVHGSAGRGLPLSDIRGKFTYDRGALETNDAAARLFGGGISVNGTTNFVREKRPFTGLVELTGISLKDAVSWFGQEGTGLSGRLFLTFRGTGNAEVSSINGGGSLRVEEAELPSFPAVGKVQALLGGIVPAFGIRGGGIISGAYILESGILVTSDLTVGDGGVRIVTNGNLNFASQRVSFVSTAELEPSLAAATGLKEKTIQVEGAGPLREPVLKLRQFPVEFAAANLAQVLGTTPETIASLKALVGSEDAKDVITGTIGETPGLTFDPAVQALISGMLGQPLQPAPPVRPALRAVPQN
jgi:hypothetical protein